MNEALDAQNGFRPILCVFVCVAIDAMLNFDSDVDANVKCEHSLRFLCINIYLTVTLTQTQTSNVNKALVCGVKILKNHVIWKHTIEKKNFL